LLGFGDGFGVLAGAFDGAADADGPADGSGVHDGMTTTECWAIGQRSGSSRVTIAVAVAWRASSGGAGGRALIGPNWIRTFIAAQA
jgi:hypothetical protein